MGQNPSVEGDDHDAVVPTRSGRFRRQQGDREGDLASAMEGATAGGGGISIRKKGRRRFRRTDGTTSPSVDDDFSQLLDPQVLCTLF